MKNALFRRLALHPCAPLLLAAWVVSAPAWGDPAAVFKTYQGWRNEPVQDWRAANERVGEIGGWRAYLREAQPGADGYDHGAPQPAAPGDDAHHGHHGRHGDEEAR